jgi:DNA-binding XRE family transcriptional regulator
MNNKTQKNEFVADARARMGLIQKEFAPLIGITTDTLSMYETGKRQPSKRVLALVHRALIERGLAKEPCSPAESDLLQMYRQLPHNNQEQITGLMWSLTQSQGTKPKPRRKPKAKT